MKAGKVMTGSEAALNKIKQQTAELVIVAKDASAGTKKKMRDKCQYYEIEYIEMGDKNSLGKWIGKTERTVVVVLDEGFKKKLLELAAEKQMDSEGAGI